MKIVERVVDGVCVLDLEGRISAGDAADLLRRTVAAKVDAGSARILLNMAQVPQVDSTGLGEMVRAHTTAVRKGGAVKLVGVNKRIHDLLAITKLLTVFSIYEAEAEAVRSF
jgi:anti-sigma B factor antagonist